MKLLDLNPYFDRFIIDNKLMDEVTELLIDFTNDEFDSKTLVASIKMVLKDFQIKRCGFDIDLNDEKNPNKRFFIIYSKHNFHIDFVCYIMPIFKNNGSLRGFNVGFNIDEPNYYKMMN